MKQRLVLCLLFTLAMLYLAIPHLPFGADGLAGIFAISWAVFALIVLGGNLSGLLYSKKLVQGESAEKDRKELNPRKIKRYSR
ncbi:hypothetical protein [Bacillus sp. FJAT-45350]|uniref:hypothetical protein n=1 Tax=Bacillus sp. FJAT-45350 TaxID=2011014 RepID=UPI000BB76F4D|nr:hypothetical protein [Bacillus sp. FJAT-45350]